MPQRKSAKQALKKSKTRKERNLKIKSNIKNSIKSLKKAPEKTETNELKKLLGQIYKVLDKAAAKGMIHKNTAARKKAKASRMLKQKAS
ncbi:MAG: 30S ribosomal protein S20 [Candidatus Omnitrophica bacterium]|nr:30S ribosomal protein S20 [Candidatus Omnitrophota bacterium]MDD5081516.1 30S ribosomal protein S20 [Candidatus Omnitrophota bacterium]MDD5441448.1 30S ribosomal protein S20 [Candidatus Omnitrophota bacterium]